MQRDMLSVEARGAAGDGRPAEAGAGGARPQSLEELGVHASRVAKRGVVTEGLMEKYATMCGVSEDELKSILVERGCEDTEEAEVLDESNYMFDARFRGVVHHLGDQPSAQAAPKMGTRAVVMQDVPTQYGVRSAVSGVDSSDATLFSMQRKLRKLSFENSNMQRFIEAHNLEYTGGLNDFEMLELNQLHDELCSDRSDLLQEVNELRLQNAHLRDQIDHLPTEARLYRESMLNASMDQEDDLPAVQQSRAMKPRAMAVVPVGGDAELERRNQELQQRLEETKKQLQKANNDFGALCESLEKSSRLSVADLEVTVRDLKAQKEKLEEENRKKDEDIADARAEIRCKEEQLQAMQRQAELAKQLADPSVRRAARKRRRRCGRRRSKLRSSSRSCRDCRTRRKARTHRTWSRRRCNSCSTSLRRRRRSCRSCRRSATKPRRLP